MERVKMSKVEVSHGNTAKNDFNVNQEKNKQVFKFAGKQFHKT